MEGGEECPMPCWRWVLFSPKRASCLFIVCLRPPLCPRPDSLTFPRDQRCACPLWCQCPHWPLTLSLHLSQRCLAHTGPHYTCYDGLLMWLGLPWWLSGKESAGSAGAADVGSIPGSGMTTHPSILAWTALWTEKPGGLPYTGLQRVGHNWSNLTHLHALTWLSSLRCLFESYHQTSWHEKASNDIAFPGMKSCVSLLCPWITASEKDSLETVFCLQLTNIRLCKRAEGRKGRNFSCPLWSVLVLRFPKCASSSFSLHCLLSPVWLWSSCSRVLTPSQSCLARFGYHYLGKQTITQIKGRGRGIRGASVGASGFIFTLPLSPSLMFSVSIYVCLWQGYWNLILAVVTSF